MMEVNRSLSFPVELGYIMQIQARSRFKIKKCKHSHSTDFNPANGCVGRKPTDLLMESGLDLAGDQRNKLQKAQGNLGGERLRDGSPAVKIIPSTRNDQSSTVNIIEVAQYC